MLRFAKVLVILLIGTLLLTGWDRVIHKQMMASMTPMEMPTAEDSEAFTIAFVEAAIDFQKVNGTEATSAHYNDPASIDGQWYVFITDVDDIFIAHPAAPSFVDTDLKMILGLDGSPIGTDIAMAPSDGHWTEY